MKLSRNFLNDYVDVSDVDIQELANKMVDVGNEYESIKRLASSENLVVGEVLECEKHPKSEKLSVCSVDIETEVLNIVCGAPNVKKCQKVVVAKVGAILPGDFEIKKANILDVESKGMICSLLELGIDKSFLNQSDIDGIHELSSDAKVGSDPNDYLKFDDYIVDFELTANRGDLMSVIGMAHEVSAIFGKEVSLPNKTFNESSEDINNEFTLEVETEKCMAYLAKLVKNVKVEESPQYIKSRLIASGIRPINNVVDISNYVMLETGQPLHFFDADKLNKNLLITEGEKFDKITTLDGVLRDVHTNDILVTDTKNPIALAGVMGSLDTEVTAETKNILIESAQFDPISVRLTSKRVLRSEASSRFEKGIDPNMTLFALERACHLLEKYAQGDVSKGILKHDQLVKEPTVIEVSLNDIKSTLGLGISSEEVKEVFNRLGFEVQGDNNYIVNVPKRRLGVEIKEDLIEEVGRIYGYSNLQGILPKSKVKRGGYSKKGALIRDVEDILSSLGLYQAVNYTLESDLNGFSFHKDKVALSNPMSDEKKVCRQNLTNGLLENCKYNFARGIKDISLFEISNVYYKDNDYIEDLLVSGILSGKYLLNEFNNNLIKADFYLVKGVVETLLNKLGLNGRFEFIEEDVPDNFHPYRTVSIYVNRVHVGYVGQIHPAISKNEVYFFEINLSKLMDLKVRGIRIKEISKYPNTIKDLSFVMPNEVKSSEIEKHIRKVANRYLNDLYVFDVYNFEDGTKALAFKLVFEDKTQTLSDEFVNDLLNKIIENVSNKSEAKLRDK